MNSVLASSKDLLMSYKFKSVKLWMMLGLIALMTTLNFYGTVNSGDYIDFIKWTFGIFVAGNVGSKVITEKVKQDDNVDAN